jgi:hypothetical protein
MQNTNDFIARKISTLKQHAHKHGTYNQEHTKVFVTTKTHQFPIIKTDPKPSRYKNLTTKLKPKINQLR